MSLNSRWLRLVLCGLIFALAGCGFRELPGLKAHADAAFKEVMLQYRLRADLVPHFLKLIEGRKESTWLKLSEDLKRAHGNAIGVDMGLDKMDERQANRMASFQYQLSRELENMKTAMESDGKIKQNGEYASLKEQLQRAEVRIASARQRYMAEGPTFNQRIAKGVGKWANKWLYKFEPAPVLQ